MRDQPVTSIHPNNVTTKSQLDTFTIFPKKINFGHNKLAVFLVEALQKDDIVKVKIDKLGDIFEISNIRRKNPFTLQLTIPGKFSFICIAFYIKLIYILQFRKLLRYIVYDSDKNRKKWY